MTGFNWPPDAVQLMKELQSRIERLERAPRMTSTSVDDGDFTVTDTDGSPLLRAGSYNDKFGEFGLNQNFRGVAMFRADGTVAFLSGTFPDQVGSPDVAAFMDNNGKPVLMDDLVASNGGLAKPYIPVTVGRADPTNWPTTTQGSFTSLHQSYFARQHPKMYIRLKHFGSIAATTGEVRIVLDGSMVAGPYSVTNTVNTEEATFTVPDDLYLGHDMTIDARRTGGAGTIGVEVIGAFGVQS